jgi:hypothetical protein
VDPKPIPFYGWRVVAAAFVLAVFGWGFGFYGPPIFLHVVREARGWPLSLVSTAVTVHFLVGAVVIANLPKGYHRFGVPAITKVGALSLAIGTAGWTVVAEPWQIFGAAVLSGAGWVALGAAAVNAIVSPWFVRHRPSALALAYNGASIGGVVFSPLWVATIAALGFPAAALLLGVLMVLTIWILADRVFAMTPEAMGQAPDGDASGGPITSITSPAAMPLSGWQLWRNAKFVTLAGGMAFGLFAQIGLIAHLFSLLVPALGRPLAGLAMGGATAAAIAGRTLAGWVMPPTADRRLVACTSYAVQIAGSFAFIVAVGSNVSLLIIGTALFGLGIGNATSLPPLIAQVEFVKADVARVVALVIAIAQGAYAFAPAVFGLVREFAPQATGTSPGDAPILFAATILLQALAIAAFLVGRQQGVIHKDSKIP